MKKISKKLCLNKEVVRSLSSVALTMANGGKPNPTRTVCGACPATQPCGGGDTGSGNLCLQTEFACH